MSGDDDVVELIVSKEGTGVAQFEADKGGKSGPKESGSNTE